MSEQADSLRSKSYARILDLISEGEIEGLTDGLKSVYLDETPVQNSDGTFNFQGVQLVTRNGVKAQDHIPGFVSTENTIAVGTEVKASQPITRTINTPNLDAVTLLFSVPQLTSTDPANGNTSGSTVNFKVEVQSGGSGAFVPQAVSSELYAVTGYQSGGAWIFNSPVEAMSARLSVRWAPIGGLFSSFTSASFAVDRDDGMTGWVQIGTINLSAADIPEPVVTDEGLFGVGSAVSGVARNFANGIPGSFLDTNAQIYSWRVRQVTGAGTWTASCTVTRPSSTASISGKTSSKYQRQYRIPLSGTGPWTIRVTRLTADSTSQYLQNKLFWDSYVETIDTKLQYPYSALAALSIDAEQFQGIPTRAYDVRLLKVKVPSNYDPLTRTYSGMWDGTFKVAWSNNPAWCFYDLLTNPRYGLGKWVGTGVDKWALYQIGRYCDEAVPDGFGGVEPRFTCNVYLSTRAEAYKVINDFASIFRGMVFWASGAITAVQDAPSSPAYLYTPANVIDGSFNYSGSAAKARHSVALVTWNDPSDMYRQKVEYVEDKAAIDRFGLVTTEVAAIGCTSRGQANRVGRWLLMSERLESEVVTFKTGLDGAICRPGQVIKVADPLRAGVRFGGRIKDATVSQITLDAPVTLATGQTYTFSALKSDGTVVESTVTTGNGVTNTLALSPALPEVPATGSIWVLASSQVQAQLFRVISVSEKAGAFEVTALATDPSKYAAIEQGLQLEARSISVLDGAPAPVSGIAVSETLYVQGAIVRNRMDVSWQPSRLANTYAVSIKRGDGNWSPEVVTSNPSAEFYDVQEAAYEVRVYAVGPLGARSTPATARYVVLGKVAPPSNVNAFVVTRYGDQLTFTWAPVGDIDLNDYEVRRGETWATGVVVGNTTATTLTTTAPRGGVFMVKARNTSGTYSAVEAMVAAPDLTGINVVMTYDESVGGFNGTKTGTLELQTQTRPGRWDQATTWDDAAQWDAFDYKNGITIAGPQTWSQLTSSWRSYAQPWLFNDVVAASPYSSWASMTQPWASLSQPWQSDTVITGTYVSEVIDILNVASCLVTVNPRVELLAATSRPWTAYTQPWSAYAAPSWTWQGRIDAIGVSYEISTSDDGVNWSSWFRFGVGTYRFRYLRMRVTLTTKDPNFRPYLTELSVTVDVPDRLFHAGDVSVPSTGATITFTPAFVDIKTVQVTLQSSASGDRFTVSNKTASSVQVQVFDSAGVPKAGVVDVDVFGFGEKY